MLLRKPHVFLLVALACGTAEKVKDSYSSDTNGGSAGASSSEEDPCDAPNAFPIWGKPYDDELDCIDTEHAVEGVACTLRPEEGDDPYYSDGFTCLKSKTSEERVWVFAYNRVGFKASRWERCPGAPLIAPMGCYAAGCQSAPRSTCSLEETRRMFSCGPTSEYDDDCCSRPDCETDSDCAENETCMEFTSLGQWYCWDNPGNTCDCGGPLGGPARLRCIAK